jgi:DNA repair protein RadA/Sms
MIGYGSSITSKLNTLEDINSSPYSKISSGKREVDHVLCGGLIKGKVYLLAADPGTGKSTLCMQIISELSNNWKALYVTSEEDLPQVKDRGERLESNLSKIYVQASSNLIDICNSMRIMRPDFMILDSIQALTNPDKSASAGSPSQIKSCTEELTKMAKTLGICLIIIGHVTKSSEIAGPIAMQHIVDAVLRMSRDNLTGDTVLSCIKTRMGSTENIGLMKMTHKGLIETSYKEILEKKSDKVLIPLLNNGRFTIAEIDCLVSFSGKPINSENIQTSHIKRVIEIIKANTGFDFSRMSITIRSSEPISKDDTYADLGIFYAMVLAFLLIKPKGYVVLGSLNSYGEVEYTTYMNNILSYCKQAGVEKIISSSKSEAKTKFNTVNEMCEYILKEDDGRLR